MIIINKFGGGIIDGAIPIKHLLEVFKNYSQEDYFVNVFSAFGKTTNELEKIAKAWGDGNMAESKKLLENLYFFHIAIATELFPEGHAVFTAIENEFKKMSDKLSVSNSIKNDLQFIDQILPHGEMLATLIISNYFKYIGISHKLIHATDFLQTDSNFGSANVDKKVTALNLNSEINEDVIKSHKHIITQGFVGFCKNENKNDAKNGARFMTTLGRGGSDYTAGLLGNLLNANKVILWKDVPGVMDEDPKLFGNDNVKKIDFLTYENLKNLLQTTALGLVHPKTLNEVKEKRIPLQIRPFWDLNSEGTLIS